jgi:ABC-2 type transport system permease protein
MPTSYNQSRALWAITRASFKAIFSNPGAIFFSILFPIIFIMIFGAFGNNGAPKSKIAIAAGSDTNNVLYDSLRNHPYIRITRYTDTAAMNKDFARGNLAGVVDIQKIPDTSGKPRYRVHILSTSASQNSFGQFMQTLQYLVLKLELGLTGQPANHFSIQPEVRELKQFRSIDFILPGQLGFSILFSTLFGIAFTFFSLREQLVLKRFYASPIHRINILLGIGMSRLFFQLMNVIILILFGHYLLNFNLEHGFLTFIQMLGMTVIMLFLLMGVGLIFSSIVKSDTSIPLLINLFGFPQMLLSGTFFPIEVFPKWLQEICYFLPLTQFNNSMRKLSFEGLSIFDCWKEIGILGIWILITYAILARLLKWE